MSRNKKQPTWEELQREEDIINENNARLKRIWTVQEKLEAIGIDIADLVDLIDDYRSRGY